MAPNKRKLIAEAGKNGQQKSAPAAGIDGRWWMADF